MFDTGIDFNVKHNAEESLQDGFITENLSACNIVSAAINMVKELGLTALAEKCWKQITVLLLKHK